MPQAATTGNLENAQRIVIGAVRYTEEHNAPAMELIEHMTLGQGEKQVTVPKVGQMTILDLVDGQDIVDEEEIGMTTVDLTAAEVGAKIILTDQLVAQSQPAVFSMVGRQLGDGMARKKDTDVIALYTALNGGTSLGAADKAMSVANFAASIANARGKTTNPFNPTYAVHHPHSVYDYVSTATAIGSSNVWPEGFQQDRLDKFWSRRSFNGVMLFEDGNIAPDSGDDAIGVLAQKDAMVVLTSVNQKTERQRDASLRGTEVVMTARYGVFELDDEKGYPLTFDASAPTTSA
mgnify:CR=1 FL=1